jgi:uncharacterized protein (TIGR03067 family)
MSGICRTLLAFAVMLVGIDVSADDVKDDAKDDLKAIQGTWDLVRIERDGKALKAQEDTRAITTGNKFVIKTGDKVIAAGTFKLDPSKKPKTLETTYTEGPNKGKTLKGIYHLDGDTLKFCVATSPDGERPTEFKTKPDSGAFLAVYKKAKR